MDDALKGNCLFVYFVEQTADPYTIFALMFFFSVFVMRILSLSYAGFPYRSTKVKNSRFQLFSVSGMLDVNVMRI
jgi:predicted membrane channel-forming protein YqfA (hemolysin III family)